MDPVQQLLADLQAGTIEDADALNARLADLSNEQLAEFEAAALGLMDEIYGGTVEVEGDRLEALETLALGVEGTRGEAERRMTAATEERERMDAAMDRVRPIAETDPPAEPEPVADPVADSEMPPADPEAEPAPEPEGAAPAELEPVPAAAAPRLSRVAVRRPPERAPRQASTGRTVITAAAEIPGYGAGQELPDMDAVVAALSARADHLRRMTIPNGSEVNYHVATFRSDYPEEQDLRPHMKNAQAVEQVVTAALGRRGWENIVAAMTAAGGYCAPPTPLYDQISIADAGRPVRSALPGFQATRGQVSFMPSPVWTDYASGVRRWTATNDTEALSNANVRKPCVRVDCDDITTVSVDAIPVCVTVGNFFDRTFDERRTAILEDVMAWQARFAERRLLTVLAGNSTNVSAGQTLGTTRDVLAILDRAIAGFFSRFRVGDGFMLELFAPRWLRNNMRADLVRALPVSGATLEENLAVADAQLERLLTLRGLNVTWIWDGEDGGTDQEFGAEAGGSLQNWPTRTILYLFHPGAHRFLDGGQLDLGIVRDSTLNATNDLQIWSETFEGLMTPGLESLRIDMDICPSGEISGTTDVTGAICTTGS